MKNKYYFILLSIAFILLQSCSSIKVNGSWKADASVIESFKEKNVLVIARTADLQARVAFETEIADALSAKGIKVTESFRKAPKIYPGKEISEERIALMKSLLKSEGYNAIVLTVIKDKTETVKTTYNDSYYGGYNPNYYGGFYNYYGRPYAYGSYYGGGYGVGVSIPLGGSSSSSTYVETDYILETVAYNLDEAKEKQLVAVVTLSLGDPKEAHKTAKKYVDLIVEEFTEDK